MLTLLRENSVSCKVLAALQLGRAQRNPDTASRPVASPLMAAGYIQSLSFPGAFPDPAVPQPEAAFPRDIPTEALIVNPARRRGMVLQRSSALPALLQRRPGRHLTLVAHEAIAQ